MAKVYFWVKAWERGEVGIWEEFGAISLTFLEYLLVGVAQGESVSGPKLIRRTPVVGPCQGAAPRGGGTLGAVHVLLRARTDRSGLGPILEVFDEPGAE